MIAPSIMVCVALMNVVGAQGKIHSLTSLLQAWDSWSLHLQSKNGKLGKSMGLAFRSQWLHIKDLRALVQWCLGDQCIHRQGLERPSERSWALWPKWSENPFPLGFSFPPDCLPSLDAFVYLRRNPVVLSIFQQPPNYPLQVWPHLGKVGPFTGFYCILGRWASTAWGQTH